jgi:uncharacterized protein
MIHKMSVFGFTLDTIAQRPVVILKDAEENHAVPIWISPMEAVSVAVQLISSDITAQSGREDLFSKLLERMDLRVEQVSIESIDNATLGANVLVSSDTGEIKLDVRPFEAIVVSLRYGLPILVSDEVMARASTVAMSDETIARENDARRFIDFLEKLDPSDLGKYPM